MKALESYIDQYKELELSKIVDYDKFNEYAITAHSTQIEGSTLTVQETSLLIDEGITPKGKPLEYSMMVKDHHEALQLAIAYGKESQLLTKELICRLNGAVMKNTGQQYHTVLGMVDATKGELRKGAVFVQNRYFPAYDKVPILLDALCTQINERMSKKLTTREQIDLVYSGHYNSVSIHPHYDGNGRTSRLIMNMIQRHFQLPMSIVYKEDKLEYIDALEASRKTKSLTVFKEFMDRQYIKYLSEEIRRYNSQHIKKDADKGMSFLF